MVDPFSFFSFSFNIYLIYRSLSSFSILSCYNCSNSSSNLISFSFIFAVILWIIARYYLCTFSIAPACNYLSNKFYFVSTFYYFFKICFSLLLIYYKASAKDISDFSLYFSHSFFNNKFSLNIVVKEGIFLTKSNSF